MELTRQAYLKEGQRRMELLDKLMEDKGLDAVLFTSTAQQAYMLAVKYCSGYAIPTRRDFFFKERGKTAYLFVHTAGHEFHAKRESFLPADHVIGGDCANKAIAMIGALGKAHPRLGLYEPAEIPHSIYLKIADTGAELVDVTADFTAARQPKSECELECIRAASAVAMDSFRWVVKNIRPGVTEQELVGGAEGYIRAHGGEETLVLVRSTLPHTFIARPKPIPVEEDGMFLYSVEMAGQYGYWTQCIRPIFMKKDTCLEAQRILHIIHEAENAGVEKMILGNRVCDVAKAIEDVVAKYGLRMGVWSGHGMGADLGDGVDIGVSNTMEIVPNMILTLHPSVQSDSDGLLYGNTWLAKEGGPENLTPDYAECCFIDELRALIR